jgi:riboflavin synthase alpha subunit
MTIAHDYKRGSIVNLEADVVARYVARNLRR